MEKTGYKDSEGKEFEVGDIVFNPCFRDYWIVGKYSENEHIKKYEEECPYYLAQYGDPDLYFMDLDEPAGFIIEVKSNEGDRYENALKELKQIVEHLQDKDKEEDNEQMEISNKE